MRRRSKLETRHAFGARRTAGALAFLLAVASTPSASSAQSFQEPAPGGVGVSGAAAGDAASLAATPGPTAPSAAAGNTVLAAMPRVTALPARDDGRSSPGAAPLVTASLRDGFGIRSANGAHGLRLGAVLAVRTSLDLPQGGEGALHSDVHLARLLLGGHLFGQHLRYAVSAELSREPLLRDLEVVFVWRPELQARVGRFRTPFSRQFLVPRPALQLPDRSIVSDFFRAGRETGVSLEGQLAEGRAEYRAGIFSGDGIDGPGLLAMTRLAVAPLGAVAYDETLARTPGEVRFAIGVGAYHHVVPTAQETSSDSASERTAGGLDAVVRAGPITVSAEGFIDRRRSPRTPDRIGVGAFAQAGVFVVPGTFEVAGRFSWLAPDVGTCSSPSIERYEVGTTYHVTSGGLKLQSRLAHNQVTPEMRDPLLVTGQEVHLQVLLSF
ncbi:hypothetical protein [Chondromyces crocatus]|nr:hypothetical protein [Chondromyces crocatus]